MFTCLVAICLFQLPSHVPGKTDFVVTDTVHKETLTVEWVGLDMTKNIIKSEAGEECWLYNGEATSTC